MVALHRGHCAACERWDTLDARWGEGRCRECRELGRTPPNPESAWVRLAALLGLAALLWLLTHATR
jgi:hypothetical protein